MKKVLLVLIAFLIIGCSPDVEVPETVESVEEVAEEPSPLAEEPVSEEACTAQWRCISSYVKAYQIANCSFTERKDCTLGCENGSCAAGKTCHAGFFCKNENTRAYRTEVCSWRNEKDCEFGCEDAECLNATNATIIEEPEEEVPTGPANRVLKMQETTSMAKDGISHNISLYLIEPGRVRLNIDNERTDWIMEGTNTTIFGLRFSILEVLFQSYAGGKRELVFTVE